MCGDTLKNRETQFANQKYGCNHLDDKGFVPAQGHLAEHLQFASRFPLRNRFPRIIILDSESGLSPRTFRKELPVRYYA